MKFWDSSAVITLCVIEPTSGATRLLLPCRSRDGRLVVDQNRMSLGLMRRYREGALTGQGLGEGASCIDSPGAFLGGSAGF